MIEKLQTVADQADDVMDHNIIQVQEGVEQTAMAGQALDELTQAAGTIMYMSTQIATASEQQGTVAEEINRNVNNISLVSEQTSTSSNETQLITENYLHRCCICIP